MASGRRGDPLRSDNTRSPDGEPSPPLQTSANRMRCPGITRPPRLAPTRPRVCRCPRRRPGRRREQGARYAAAHEARRRAVARGALLAGHASLATAAALACPDARDCHRGRRCRARCGSLRRLPTLPPNRARPLTLHSPSIDHAWTRASVAPHAAGLLVPRRPRRQAAGARICRRLSLCWPPA